MKNTIHSEVYKNYTINILPDFEPFNPRTEWDNFGHMICFHRRYNLGDKHNWNIDDFKEFIEKSKNIICLPLYLYDHSGITINTSGFSCPWDSGQVGMIYVTYEEIKKEFGVKIISQKTKKKVIEWLEAEVKTYDDYITGRVYGYSIEETGESLFGFYGDFESCLQEAKSTIEWTIRSEIKNHCQKVKNYIKNHVPEIYREACPIKQ